ncbi:MAG: hypothetical protein WCS87_04455 [Methylococcaceae bacterium]
MLKSYEAIYTNNQLNWLNSKPNVDNVKVLVIFEEYISNTPVIKNSIKNLKGLVPKPEKSISLDEMKQAIELEGAKR